MAEPTVFLPASPNEEADEKTREGTTKPRHRHHKETHGRSDDIDETTSVDEVKGPNLFQRVKEEVEALVEAIHPKENPNAVRETKEADEKTREGTDKPRHRHHKETHGRSDDIDETTSVDDVKGPNVFQRVKEEVEALAEAIHHRKRSDGGHE